MVDHANVIQDFDGNINKHIPLAPNLRQEYQDILGDLGPIIPKFIDCETGWEIKVIGVLYDEDPSKSFWPSRAIDNKYHLFRNGFNFEEPEGAESPLGALNRVSNGLGLTPLVEQEQNYPGSTSGNRKHIKNQLYSPYQGVDPGHGGSISLSRGIGPNPLVIVFLGILYFWCFAFGRGTKKVPGKSFPPHLRVLRPTS